ncbi:hypothetical protein [Cellulomonas fimi]|uniref:hypothetical protein n=1 Tax=Cellulomonas sp. RIT-PI-Y TaxID=3035297 RepID=UPI0021D86361
MRDSTTITPVRIAEVPAQLLTGPARHGVARYAREVAEQVARVAPETAVVEVDDPAGLASAVTGHERAHLHVTDRLLGASPDVAAERVEALTGRTRLTVTLHDVPQESDGPRNLARRGAAYSRICAAAEGVVVNSRHEADLLVEHEVVRPGTPVGVIPLGAGGRRAATTPRPHGLTALIAGWLYPGKGHDDLIRAVAEAGGGTVLAVGAPSPGHEEEVARLTALAAGAGVVFRVTGSLGDAEYAAALGGDGVPVAAHRHLSASRTLLDWGEQGRRPLVADSRYAREMSELRPGTLSLYPPDGLADALRAAAADPGSTVLAPGVGLAPTLADVAVAYLRWWGSA